MVPLSLNKWLRVLDVSVSLPEILIDEVATVNSTRTPSTKHKANTLLDSLALAENNFVA